MKTTWQSISPIVTQIKRNRGTGKCEQVQFISINCHQIPFTIMKSPLKFASISTLNPCLFQQQPSTIRQHEFDSWRSANIFESFFFVISLSVRSTILHNFYQGYNLKYLSRVYERETTKTHYETYLSIIVAACRTKQFTSF